MKAVLKQIRISPKKANLVAGMVRGKKVSEALNFLKLTPKKAAKIIVKVIESAAANAENNHKQDKDKLIITRILVTKGATYKRSIPKARGRVAPILKYTSHITVEVGQEEDTQKEEGRHKKDEIHKTKGKSEVKDEIKKKNEDVNAKDSTIKK